jgi:phage terminase small subunit
MAKKKTPPKSRYPQFEGLDLNPQQQDFVYFYCHPDVGYNGTRAYCKAYGLSDIDDYASAATSAGRLLKNVEIMDAVDIERKRRLESHEDLANFVMAEWYKMAQADITEALNITGPIVMVKDLSEIPQHLRNCIKSVKTTSSGVEVAFHDKHKALENLAKALGMFVERTQNVNSEYESLVEKIDRKRREERENNTDLPAGGN